MGMERLGGRWFGVGLAIGLALTLTSGCALGPSAIRKVQPRYNESLRQVGDQQLLLNIVRLRYNEPLSRLDVSSIAAQFELNSTAGFQPLFGVGAAGAGERFMLAPFSRLGPYGSASAADRPTVTLTPGESPESVRRLFQPLTLEGVIFLAGTSWPPETIMRLWLESLNGVYNAAIASGPTPRVAPRQFAEFRRAVELIQRMGMLEELTVTPDEHVVEVSGPLPESEYQAMAAAEAARNGNELIQRADGAWVLIRRDKGLSLKVSPQAVYSPEMMELCALLNLQPGLSSYRLTVYSDTPFVRHGPPTDSVAMEPRSLMQVLFFLAQGVVVPPEHFAEGVATLTRNPDGTPFDYRNVLGNLFTVCSSSSHKPPEHAYVAVRYRDHWYYIDDRDQATKATFTLVTELGRLDFGAGRPAVQGAPLLTLPVGR